VSSDGRSAGLHSFNMGANWFQKERLNYGRKIFWQKLLCKNNLNKCLNNY